MPYRDMDVLDFKRILFLGGRISAKHKDFQTLAQLGYDEARKIALLDFIKFRNENPDVERLELYRQLLIFKGRANLLPTLKELTRLSMILGDTTDFRSYKGKEEDGT